MVMRANILNNRKRRPTHPGELLREEILPAIALDQGRLAERLGVSRQSLNELVNERRSVSIDMAYRLGRLFDMDPTTWIRMQEAVDAWDMLQAKSKEYDKIKPLSR
jgi:addiction module HigA family antidote